MKIIFGIGLEINPKRLKKLGFTKSFNQFNNPPTPTWVLGNHMTDCGDFADTIVYDPDTKFISASYGGNMGIPEQMKIENTWELRQFLKTHSHENEEPHKNEEPEKLYQRVILRSYSDKKYHVLKTLKDYLKITLLETKRIIDNVPCVIIEDVTEDEINKLKALLDLPEDCIEVR